MLRSDMLEKERRCQVSDIEKAQRKAKAKARAATDEKIIARAAHLAETLPVLPSPWQWARNSETNVLHAVLFTQDQDCYVSIDDGSVRVSTGLAPVEVVAAVIKARGKGGAK